VLGAYPQRARRLQDSQAKLPPPKITHNVLLYSWARVGMSSPTNALQLAIDGSLSCCNGRPGEREKSELWLEGGENRCLGSGQAPVLGGCARGICSMAVRLPAVGGCNNQVFTVRDIGISCRSEMSRMSFGLARKTFLVRGGNEKKATI
jgi:hypothetical protein